MKQQIQINSGKTLALPSRMFKPKDLKDMGVDFVEQKIMFNLSQKNGAPEALDEAIAKNMVVGSYQDFSQISFSIQALSNYVDEQVNSDVDVVFLPYFKDENDYDIREKIKLAGILKNWQSHRVTLTFYQYTAAHIMEGSLF